MATYNWTICVIAQVDNHPTVGRKYSDFIDAINNVPSNASIRYVILEYRQINSPGTPLKILKLVKTTSSDSFSEEPFLSSNDFYQKQTLIDFFNLHVLNEESNNHMLITWGHGAGLGFFKEDIVKNILGHTQKTAFNKQVDELMKYAEVEFLMRANGYSTQMPVRESLKGFAQWYNFRTGDTKSGIHWLNDSILKEVFNYKLVPIDDFADALRQSFGKKRKTIKLMYTLNCYMQTIETGFTLSEFVEILVSPVSKIPFHGIDNVRLFKNFNELHPDDPKLRPEEIASDMIKHYPHMYQNDPDFKKVNYRLSANYPGHYKNIIDKINQFCKFYEVNGDNWYINAAGKKKRADTHIRDIRNDCDDPTGTLHFIPVGEFFNRLQMRFRDFSPLEQTLIDDAAAIHKMANDAVIASYPDISTNVSFQQWLPFITFFFPGGKTALESRLINYYMQTYFNDDDSVFTGYSQWDGFVRKYTKWAQPINKNNRLPVHRQSIK